MKHINTSKTHPLYHQKAYQASISVRAMETALAQDGRCRLSYIMQWARSWATAMPGHVRRATRSQAVASRYAM